MPDDYLDDMDEMTACRLLLIDMGYTPGEPYTQGSEAMIEQCGFCGGRGWVLSVPYDRYGAAVEQRRMSCEHCGGDGVCERGGKLLAASRQAAPAGHAADLAGRGTAAWM